MHKTRKILGPRTFATRRPPVAYRNDIMTTCAEGFVFYRSALKSLQRSNDVQTSIIIIIIVINKNRVCIQ